jgi:hypothetical protein
MSSPEQRASMITQLQQSYGNAHVQRVMERIQAEKGSGRPLESDIRSEMETGFNRDFSDVTIHTDASADNLAEELGAKAVTSGKDIFFSEGAYNPDSEAGKTLLGHELTHVIQQEGISAGGNESIGKVGDVFEQEADLMARALTGGRDISVEVAAAAPSLQMTELRGGLERASTGTATEETGADDTRLAALRAAWDAVVVNNITEAHESLQEAPPDFETSMTKVHTAAEFIHSIMSAYRDREPAFGQLATFHQYLQMVYVQIEAHTGAARPVETIIEHLNPSEGSMEGWLSRARDVL